MKLKRLVATMLTLLLMVSLLPIGAMADDLPNYDTDQGNINEQIGTNIAIAVDINKNGSVQTNTGSVHENEGTVVNNNGTVVINKAGGTIETNNGTVLINQNIGTVETNNGTVGFQKSDGSVEPTSGNYGTIYYNENGGRVLINQNTGVVDLNKKGGTIETNKGIVGSQDQFGNAEPTSGNYGTVKTNNGKVLINQAGGTIDTNYGLVGKQIGDNLITDDDTGNFGEVTTNYGNITQNKNLVVTNGKISNANGYIRVNVGTVKNNESNVWDNNGTVETNKAFVENNNENGTVQTNNVNVKKNSGKVVTNNGEVTDNYGTVQTNNKYISKNYGTVNLNGIDGSVGNYNSGEIVELSLDNEDAAPSEGKPVVAGVGTNFGIVNNYHVDGKTYYGLSWGDNVNSLNSIESFVERGAEKNLDEIASGVTRDGYKMTGYTAYYRQEGKDVEIDNTANYLMNAPTWLKILWEKLGKSTQPTRTPVYTKLSAEQVKVGTFVRCGEMTFKIIEVTDDSIRVATVGKLSDTALADMLGFLKQHLSDAQIAKLIGAPELLEQELVSKFFGGSNEHIAFYASPDLFA